jgi:hypothetical protein
MLRFLHHYSASSAPVANVGTTRFVLVKGACILPHGVLFRGNAEAEIRRNLIRRGYIKGIIGLPANLFYGTGIPACIVVIDKQDAHTRKGIFMIDASAGFLKDGNKNRLRTMDIHKIVDVFNRRLELSRMVSIDAIVRPSRVKIVVRGQSGCERGEKFAPSSRSSCEPRLRRARGPERHRLLSQPNGLSPEAPFRKESRSLR